MKLGRAGRGCRTWALRGRDLPGSSPSVPDSSQLVDLQESFWQLRACHQFPVVTVGFGALAIQQAVTASHFLDQAVADFRSSGSECDLVCSEAGSQ